MSNIPKVYKDFCATFSTQIDLHDKLHYVATLSSGLVTLVAGKAAVCLGIIDEEVLATSTTEKTVRIQIGGIARVKTGGNITALDYVIADTDGTVITDDAANQFVVGMALEDGTDGDIISVRLILAPTTTA